MLNEATIKGELNAIRNVELMKFQDILDLPATNLFESITDNAFYTPHQLLTIGGRPDVGKTQMAMHIAKTQLLNDKYVAYFGLEEEAGEIYTYIEQFIPVERAEKLLVQDYTYTELNELTGRIRAIYERYNIDFFVIDQLSLIDVDDTPDLRAKFDRTQRVLQVLTKELPITILQITQMNRALENDDEMPENKIAESDRIFQNSKWFGIFFKLEDVDSQTVKMGLRIRKSKKRNGSYANYVFKFDYEASTMFELKELSDDEYIDEARGKASNRVSGGNSFADWVR